MRRRFSVVPADDNASMPNSGPGVAVALAIGCERPGGPELQRSKLGSSLPTTTQYCDVGLFSAKYGLVSYAMQPSHESLIRVVEPPHASRVCKPPAQTGWPFGRFGRPARPGHAANEVAASKRQPSAAGCVYVKLSGADAVP